MRWQQQWNDVLFLHYVVKAVDVEPLLPPHLKLDLYDGQAWLSLVFFRLRVRPLGWPPVPGFSTLLELNIRTYVTCGNLPGIYFLRMYADNSLAIAAARLLTPLRYRLAAMHSSSPASQPRQMACRPREGGGVAGVSFQVSGHFQTAVPGSLDEWLLERYRLFVEDPHGRLCMGQVQHVPWSIAPVHLLDLQQTLGDQCGMSDQGLVAVHYSPGVSAQFGTFQSPPATHVVRHRWQPQPVHAIARCGGR